MNFKDEIAVLFKSHKKHLGAVLLLGFILGIVVCSCSENVPMPTMEESE